MKDKVVPGLFSMACFRGLFLWIIPMTCFMLTLDVLAISGDSLIYSPILMALMLQPVFTKPISVLIKNFSKLGNTSFCRRFKTENVYLIRLFTFSIDIYISLIIGVQYYFFTSWLTFAEKNSVQLDGFTKQDFNFCKAESSKENSNLNFQEVLTLLPSTEKSYALLGMSFLMIVYHIIKSCLVNQFSIVPLSVFVFGPEDEIEDKPRNLDEIELSSIHNEEREDVQSQDGTEIGMTDFLWSLLGQLYIIAILLFPLTFDKFTNDDAFGDSKFL